jgi:ADP-heptose:LPS heptosyltransferase
MGFGDEIMATAQAREISRVLGVSVSFRDNHEIFKNNPYIVTNGGFRLVNEQGNRPYILAITPEKIVYNPNFRAVPGEFYFTEDEIREAHQLIGQLKDFVIIEPSIKNKFSQGNKDWGWDNWERLVHRLKDYTLVQLVPDQSAKKLAGVRVIETKTFRIACAVLKESTLFVGTEGGLHHAAAALKVRAVVIWSGYSHPLHLGYPQHANIRADNSPPCGSRASCDHCKAMMAKISIQHVHEAIDTV